MEMMDKTELLLERLLETENLKYCYECGRCTASCPVAKVLPNFYNPRTLLQKIVFDPDNVLKGNEIWLCAGCGQCCEVCPQEIRLPEIFLLVRVIAAEQGYSEGFMKAMEIIKEWWTKRSLPAIMGFCRVQDDASVDEGGH
ncbi:MAG: CoB--CoM heterodisulfide reductase iron-sulfur subunit C [Candidatus Methanolliviera sp. GoM_oil]|nr:MAG: CoB--CoM heterodisulfide reductase iron-sulfur subunit C [Candidatus Methanolliviera sp. GoM_oil]